VAKLPDPDDDVRQALSVMRWPLVSGLALLLIRGVLLWVVVPFAALGWVVAWPVRHFKKVGLGQLIGWSDLNLIAAVQRSILRPFTRRPLGWTSLKALPNVAHRIRLLDPV
jgi:hypothetical protein